MRRRNSRDFLKNIPKRDSSRDELQQSDGYGTISREKERSPREEVRRARNSRMSRSDHHKSPKSTPPKSNKNMSPKTMASTQTSEYAEKQHYMASPSIMSTSGDDMLSEKDDSKRSNGSRKKHKHKHFRVPSPNTVLKSMEPSSPSGAKSKVVSQLASHGDECPMSDPNYYMYRNRSYREELDFTSNRKRSESDKRKQLLEELKKDQPLIQDRLAAELSSFQKPKEGLTRRSREISKSQGDSIDDPPSAKHEPKSEEYPSSHKKKSHHKSRDKKKEKDPTKEEERSSRRRRKSVPQQNIYVNQIEENIYDEVPSSAFSVSQAGNATYENAYEVRGGYSSRDGAKSKNVEKDEDSAYAGIEPRTMIDPPDLFNTNKHSSR